MPLFSLLQPLRTIPLAFVDVETTGASADFGHRVIELGISRWEGGRMVAEYQQLIDPGRRISPGVTALTGISQAMVSGQPDFAAQLPRAMELLRGAAVLGHNVRFDLSFLRKEFARSGQDITAALGEHVPVLDTVRIARRRFGRGGNALQNLARRFGVAPVVAHRALADAQTTALVFEHLMAPVGGWDLCLCDALREQGGAMGLLPVSVRESLLPLELEEALDQRGAVRMEYVDASGRRTFRVIEPLQVRRANGELLLVAHCHLRDDRRTFKLDRIVQLIKITGSVSEALAASEPCVDEPQDIAPPAASPSSEGRPAPNEPTAKLDPDAAGPSVGAPDVRPESALTDSPQEAY